MILSTYLQGIETDKQPSKNSSVFVDSKESNDPGESQEREDDDESLEQFPRCAE